MKKIPSGNIMMLILSTLFFVGAIALSNTDKATWDGNPAFQAGIMIMGGVISGGIGIYALIKNIELDRLSKTNPNEYQKQLDNAIKRKNQISEAISKKNIGKTLPCPQCHSWNTQKRTFTQRKIDTFLGWNEKQWHCNHCGSDF